MTSPATKLDNYSWHIIRFCKLKPQEKEMRRVTDTYLTLDVEGDEEFKEGCLTWFILLSNSGNHPFQPNIHTQQLWLSKNVLAQHLQHIDISRNTVMNNQYWKHTCCRGSCRLQMPGLCVKHKPRGRCGHTPLLSVLPLSPWIVNADKGQDSRCYMENVIILVASALYLWIYMWSEPGRFHVSCLS